MTKTLITCPHCNQPTTVETRCGVCGETIRYASGEMTEAEYLAALDEIWELFDAEPGTPEAERLVALINKVEKYEDEHYPMEMTMTETREAYKTGTETQSVAWHCVTDKYGEGCMGRMGVIHFDPTRLVVSRDGEIIAIIRGDAEIRCPMCGKPQDWHWEREHPFTKRLKERKTVCENQHSESDGETGG